MTAVVSLEHKGAVHMGGDSAISCEESVALQAEPKVFVRNGVVFGIAGQPRIEPLLRYVVDLPNVRKGTDPARWVNVDLASAIRKAMTDEGFVNVASWFEADGTAIMVGLLGKLFVVESDLCAWRPLLGYHAIGSGGEHARASLRETAGKSLQPRTRLKRALECAFEQSPFVRPPWSFVSA
jgi:hypothetical protein